MGPWCLNWIKNQINHPEVSQTWQSGVIFINWGVFRKKKDGIINEDFEFALFDYRRVAQTSPGDPVILAAHWGDPAYLRRSRSPPLCRCISSHLWRVRWFPLCLPRKHHHLLQSWTRPCVTSCRSFSAETVTSSLRRLVPRMHSTVRPSYG